MPPIVYAALAGNLEEVQKRHLAGLDINYNDPERGTALMQAVHGDYLKVALYLLENGADTKIVGPYGKPAANWCSSIRMQRLLERFGVSVPTDDPNVRGMYHELRPMDVVGYDEMICSRGLVAAMAWETGGFNYVVEEFQDALKQRGLTKKAEIINELIAELDARDEWRWMTDDNWPEKNKEWLVKIEAKYRAVKDEPIE